MIEMNRGDLAYLLFLVGKGYYTCARELLGNPFALEGRISPTQKAFAEPAAALRRLLESEEPGRHRFLDLHLITHCLLCEYRPEYLVSWLEQEADLALHFPGMEWRQLLQARWQAVPALVVHDKAQLIYIITGLLSRGETPGLWPAWAEPMMDHQCKEAIEIAASAAKSVFPIDRDKGFYCYPLLDPEEGIRIQGPSMGLGLALGFLTLAKERVMPRKLIATGRLSGTHGSIGDAELLDKKAQAAERKGFKVFLHPSCATPPDACQRLELLPVAHLPAAWMCAQLYSPEKAGDLVLLTRMLSSPTDFVDNLGNVDPEWLHWVRHEGMADEVTGLVIESPALTSNLTDRLENALKRWSLEEARAISALVSPSAFEQISRSSALTAFRFSAANMALANHRGDLAAALSWAEKGGRLFEQARKADINSCANFLNNRLVVSHNRYAFAPGVPEDLKAILPFLEKRYSEQCAMGCMVDRALGELYGTLCQNFGFCGPSSLPQCEDYARKAMKAFGGGDVPETRGEALRQYHYLACARLDAGDGRKAEEALLSNLEVEDWAGVWARINSKGLSRWQHALLARLLADTEHGSHRSMYLDWALAHGRGDMDRDHPSQLRLWNLGRIAASLGRGTEAKVSWEKSLRLCLESRLGPTVQVMALLPLSGLWRHGELSCVDLPRARRRVQEAAEALNPGHFVMLLQKSFETVLQEVWERPAQLFPFTYR
ncbi:MAG: hypothetical protein AB1512_11040 [Thermodesulfobacteriota bacterium]